ncbi:hypothetical protein ZWY2020_051733 [Hordeum vulgare]|nr:hypothetical protein ZWY2020_051733 [Hordeum vulgare]
MAHEEPAWTKDGVINQAFEEFKESTRKIVEQVDEWNNDPDRKNRHGAGMVPYVLLRPSDGDPTDEKMGCSRLCHRPAATPPPPPRRGTRPRRLAWQPTSPQPPPRILASRVEAPGRHGEYNSEAGLRR